MNGANNSGVRGTCQRGNSKFGLFAYSLCNLLRFLAFRAILADKIAMAADKVASSCVVTLPARELIAGHPSGQTCHMDEFAGNSYRQEPVATVWHSLAIIMIDPANQLKPHIAAPYKLLY